MTQKALISNTDTGLRPVVRTPGKYQLLLGVLLAGVATLMAYGSPWVLERVKTFSPPAFRADGFGERRDFYQLPELLVDLSPDKNGRTSFLKIRIDLHFDEESPLRRSVNVEQLAPEVTERLTFFLRELQPEDFAGTAQMERVKAEMMRRINLVLGPAHVQSITIREIIIQ